VDGGGTTATRGDLLLAAARGSRTLADGLGIAAALLLAAACGPAVDDGADDDPPRPNVLLVSVDTLRPDHLGCYGYERDTSPVIDRLAAEGARFETVVSSTSWTLPAHVTLFTALPPEAHGVQFDPRALEEEALCLAEVLKDAGYATAAVVGGPFLRSMYGIDQGFDVYDESVVRSLYESHVGVTSPTLVELATDWLDGWDRAGRTAPFFLFLHLWDVHYDYTPPPPYDTMFDSDYDGEIRAEDFERGEHIHPEMDPRDLDHVIALYDGEIRYTDGWIGRLLEDLRDRGVADDTIVVLTSDHGEAFFEHGVKGHRKDLYDETLMVPLVVRYPPRVPAGHVVRQQVRLMDVAHTVLALAGVDRPEGFGLASDVDAGPRDLTPYLDEGSEELPSLVGFADLHGILGAIRTPDHKLLSERGALATAELYDLAADPAESENRLDLTHRRERLRNRLQAWKAAWGRHPRLSFEMELTDEQRELLRTLGYIR